MIADAQHDEAAFLRGKIQDLQAEKRDLRLEIDEAVDILGRLRRLADSEAEIRDRELAVGRVWRVLNGDAVAGFLERNTKGDGHGT